MDDETRARLDRLEAKVDALSRAPHQTVDPGPVAVNPALKSLLFWLVILGILAVIWLTTRA